MKPMQFAATVVAVGLWIPGPTAAAQTGRDATQEQERQRDRDRDQEGRTQPGTQAQTGQTGALSSADRQFLMKAARDSMAEIQMGKLAQDRASSDAVKQFGQRLADDHQKALDSLKQIAQDKGVSLPTEIDSKQQATLDKLQKLSGAEFDREFERMIHQDHVKAVNEFRREGERSKDSEIKQFASQNVPVLEEHRNMAQNLMRGGAAAGPGVTGGERTKPRTDEPAPEGRKKSKETKPPDQNQQ